VNAADVNVKAAMLFAFEPDAAVLSGAVEIEHLSAEHALHQPPLAIVEPFSGAENPTDSNGRQRFVIDESRQVGERIGIAVQYVRPETVELMMVLSQSVRAEDRATQRLLTAREVPEPMLETIGANGVVRFFGDAPD
jgi:hypothetical protein